MMAVIAQTPLERFETLVLSQQQASEPWQPVTDYSLEARRRIEGEHPRLILRVFNPTLVVDIGCGPGHFVRLLREVGVEAYGFDVVVPPEDQREWGWFHHCDLGVHWPSVDSSLQPDLILCREVFEHLTLRQIRQAVTNLSAWTRRFVYLTMRLNAHAADLLDVATADDLDPTHITLPHPDLIRLLFVLEGLRRRADLEDRMDWQQQGRCFVYERTP